MKSNRPDVILKKYRSIFLSAVAVEMVTFIVSLIDPVIAGRCIGIDALSAISLFSPFISISTFVAAVINTGTLIKYTTMVGKFQKKRADEVFSQGVIMAVLAGVLVTLMIVLIKPLFISSLSVSAQLEGYLKRYYSIAAFYPMFFPIQCVLNNIIVAQGGEKYAACANVLCIAANLILSLWLAGAFGVSGIAAATLASNVVFTAALVMWFFIRKRDIRLVRYFSFKEFSGIVKCGIVKASKFVSVSLMLWIADLYILRNFDEVTFKVWTVGQNIIGMSSVFLGLAMTLQPMIATLLEENNTKTIRILVRRLLGDLAALGAGCTAIMLCFTGAVLRCFSVPRGEVWEQGITAVRITSLMLVFSAVTAGFFVYYILIGRQRLAFVISLLTDLICPVGMLLLFGTLFKGSPVMLWTALAVSGAVAFILCALIAFLHRGKNSFPLMLARGRDEQIHIYSFEITAQSSSEMARITEDLLRDNGFSKRLRLLVSACIEDMLGLTAQRSGNKKGHLLAECTLVIDRGSVQVIMRDNGERFDISEQGTQEYTFLRYTVERLMTVTDHNAYISTAGYNRSELFFTDNR